MIVESRKPSINRGFLLHVAFWVLYIVIVYIVNIIRYRDTTFLQFLGGIPLIMAVFYLSFHFAKSKKGFTLRNGFVLLVIPFAVLFFFICDYWIYDLLPKINIRISNYESRDTVDFAMNYLQYLIKYSFYGVFFAKLEQVKKVKVLEARLLLKGIDPHFNFNAWNGILARVGGNIKELMSFINGHIALQLYVLKAQKLDQDVVVVEMELAKMQSWIKALDRDVQIEVKGEPSGQLILPTAGIELLGNALKYSKAGTPIVVLFSLEANGLILQIQNVVDDTRSAAGLGSGIRDIKKRILLNPILKGDIQHYCTDGLYTINLILKSKNKKYEEN
ncbi:MULTISPECIES: sensor histidine kinase [Sphingobacterium]|uniref:sensor histidine kinase n=1 Tax=Sphingobacterium TaxID=28453 RepID=UPI0013DD0F4B|nr:MULTISPECIES: sensor histidine kinase [unclassified Sphingobacterium]